MKKKNKIASLLTKLERSGNKLPSPATTFFILAVLIVVISDICAWAGVSVTHNTTVDGEVVAQQIEAKSLFTSEGWNYITTETVNNFKNFYALGVVLTIMLMVGVAQGSGLLNTIVYKMAKVTPASLVTPVVAFIGIMLSIASSTGYVVLVPLAGILYAGVKRHPIAGIAVAFAATSAGWGANLLIAPNDPALAGITDDAIKLVNPDYIVNATANWYAAAAAVPLLVIIITLVDKYMVSPMLGEYVPTGDEVTGELKELTKDEKRGLSFAGISALLYVGIIATILITGLKGGWGSFAYAKDAAGEFTLIGSPFLKGIIIYMGLLFLIPGIFYGIGAKTIRSEKDVVKMMEESMRGLAPFIVIIFFAAQFTSYFAYTNLGHIIALSGARFLSGIGLTGIGLMAIFVVLMAFLNIFMAVDTAKWAIIAPIFVPMFYELGYAPEVTQMFYRVGDSSSNIIAPLMPFFPLVLSIMQRYDKKAGMGTLISTMLPYTLVIMFVWTIVVIIWVLLGIPVGPGVVGLL